MNAIKTETSPEMLMHQERKASAVKMAKKAYRKAYGLMQDANVDVRLLEYIDDVIRHNKLHNLYEILAVGIFCQKAVKYELDFKTARRFIRFYEVLPFDGTTGTTSYKMTSVQVFIIANIFALYTTNAKGEKVRLHRDVYLFVPRKFAKTTLAGAIAVWFMLFEDYNSQAYVIANSYQQARVCFDMQRNIMFALDPEQKLFRINRQEIFFTDRSANLSRASKSVCLSCSPKNLDGLFAELVIRDEGAQARDTATKSGSDLKNVLTSSEGPRRQPLNIDISTASDVVGGPFHREIEGAKEVLLTALDKCKKITTNDSLFGLLFMPDMGDDEGDPKTWKKVQPHLGITVQPDYYEKEWQRAQLSADNMLTFKTKLLNIFAVNESTPWLGASLAEKMHYRWNPLTGEGMQNLQETPIAMCAVDLSVKGDFTAVTFAAYIDDLKQTWTHTRYYLPEGVMETHPRHIHYKRLLEQGYIHLTQGDTIDYNAIADYVMEVANAGYIQLMQIGYDQYRSTPFVNRMVEIGNLGIEDNLIPMGQTMGPFTSWTMAYGQAAKTGHILIDDNPLTDEAFQGAYLETSRDEIACKPMKIDSSPTGKRIDGLITNIMAHGLFIDQGHKLRSNDLQ